MPHMAHRWGMAAPRLAALPRLAELAAIRQTGQGAQEDSVYFPGQPFDPDLIGSNACEQYFGLGRSFTPNKPNFCLREFIAILTNRVKPRCASIHCRRMSACTSSSSCGVARDRKQHLRDEKRRKLHEAGVTPSSKAGGQASGRSRLGQPVLRSSHAERFWPRHVQSAQFIQTDWKPGDRFRVSWC